MILQVVRGYISLLFFLQKSYTVLLEHLFKGFIGNRYMHLKNCGFCYSLLSMNEVQNLIHLCTLKFALH